MSQINIAALQHCANGQQLLRQAGKISRRENHWLTLAGILQTASTIAITGLIALLINNAVYEKSETTTLLWQQPSWWGLLADRKSVV